MCDCNLFSFPLILCVVARSRLAGHSAEWWQVTAAPPCPGIVPAADHHGSRGVLSGGQNAAAALRPARQTAAVHHAVGERQRGSSQHQSSHAPPQPLHQRQGWYAHLRHNRNTSHSQMVFHICCFLSCLSYKCRITSHNFQHLSFSQAIISLSVIPNIPCFWAVCVFIT